MASIFSRIAKGELPCYRIAENDQFLAFLDIRPVSPGHTLVIPKVEVDHFFDLDEDELSQILVFAKPITRAIQQVTGAARVGAIVAGFDVPHAHLHLIPVNTMIELDFSRAKSVADEQLSSMADKIRETLSS